MKVSPKYLTKNTQNCLGAAPVVGYRIRQYIRRGHARVY